MAIYQMQSSKLLRCSRFHPESYQGFVTHVLQLSVLYTVFIFQIKNIDSAKEIVCTYTVLAISRRNTIVPRNYQFLFLERSGCIWPGFMQANMIWQQLGYWECQPFTSQCRKLRRNIFFRTRHADPLPDKERGFNMQTTLFFWCNQFMKN